ncbi:hypothetical protein ACIP1U_31805 [Cupriavidus sp. NPDC089707]|uniref:hypothetical protein n=1 Tax=Cupriavidus sp. NPDC089707 TaxID=3363963 RepID=UPI0038233052
MLISPPFLPGAAAGASDVTDIDKVMDSTFTDGEWMNCAMEGGKPGAGGFPLSHSLGWHGGIHLTAKPAGSGQPLPVRTIADGTIVYLRKPQHEANDKNHALMYRGEWTDDGCVVLKHETEIGEGDNASVTFFSIYLHLSDIDKHFLDAFAKDKRVYRKDRIGTAGKIYGTPDCIHFEIICDSTNMKRLVGRDSGRLDTLKAARTDAVYGDVHFKITASTDLPILLYASEAANATQTTDPVATVIEPLYVRIRLQPEGIADKHGARYVHTYREVPPDSGNFEEVGKPLCSEDFEYRMHGIAVKTYPKCPSAGYELLRFGRVIGPDALAPVNAPLWVQINAPRIDPANPDVPPAVMQGYVNLHSNKVLGFSDADFPHWMGWTLVDDDKTPDSLCNSVTLRRWLGKDGNNVVSHREAVAQLSKELVQKRLRRAICKFPTEWEKNNIASRWGWLKSSHEALACPLTTEAYDRFERHHKALAFWDEANLGIDLEHWHFHPKEFIGHFRKCKWLSKTELQQLLPTYSIRKVGDGHNWEEVRQNDDTDALIKRSRSALNRALRKYGISSPLRIAAFFQNAIVETTWLTDFQENRGKQPDLHGGWYGRGFLQLTNPQGNLNGGNNNYYNYFRWRGHSPEQASAQQLREWRNSIQDNVDEASESAGFYWTKYHLGGKHQTETASLFADNSTPNVRIVVKTSSGNKAYYSNETARRTAAIVNIPKAVYSNSNINGMTERYRVYANALVVLTDTPKFPSADGIIREIPDDFTRRKPW